MPYIADEIFWHCVIVMEFFLTEMRRLLEPLDPIYHDAFIVPMLEHIAREMRNFRLNAGTAAAFSRLRLMEASILPPQPVLRTGPRYSNPSFAQPRHAHFHPYTPPASSHLERLDRRHVAQRLPRIEEGIASVSIGTGQPLSHRTQPIGRNQGAPFQADMIYGTNVGQASSTASHATQSTGVHPAATFPANTINGGNVVDASSTSQGFTPGSGADASSSSTSADNGRRDP